MANGYSTSMSGMGITETAIIPQGVMNVIRVNETTPNLQLIQSFPVISRNGNIHIHQDPVTGQMYEMTDEFHSMIPQIIAGNSSVMTGGVIPTTTTNIGDVNFISDDIENYSVILVKESTPNLSKIFTYLIYSTDGEFTYYSNSNDKILYAVPNELKENISEIISAISGGYTNIIPDAITDFDVFNRVQIFETNDTIQKTSLNRVTRIPNYSTINRSTSRYAYPSVLYSQTTQIKSSISFNSVSRHVYPYLGQ